MTHDANIAGNLARIRSSIGGMAWPALPSAAGSLMLALQFELDETQWWPPEKLAQHQFRQFLHLFRHAIETVPFYQARFAGISMSGPEDYRQLPLLARAEVQAAGEAMLSRAVPPAHGALTTTQSSGSTARPLVTTGTGLTQLIWRTLVLREHLWHRRDFGGKLAAIRSKAETAALAGWGAATDPVFNTGPAALLDLTIDLDEQIRWLKAQDPDYVISFATNIYLLARRSRELGVRLPRLREVRTYGETLRPDMRALVREAWGVAVVDVYSAEELGYIALQCPEHEHYHVQSESLMLEVLREDGTACAPGEIGQVVVTTLHNFAMPLVRYASGDYAEAGAPCPCGRGLPVLKRIAGRQRNMVVRPDGVRHWPSFPSEAWREVAPVRQLQLTQTSVDEIVVRVVAARALAPAERDALVAALQKCLGHPFRMRVEEVAEIPRAASRKFEDFISEIAPV